MVVTVNPDTYQVVADRVQRAGAVVHDERGARHGLRTRMARSNPSSAQYQRDVMGCGATDREGENPAWPQRAVHAGEQRGPFGGQEVPVRPEADRQVEGPGEGQGPGMSPLPRGVRVRTARLGEHAGAEVNAPMTGPWHTDPRTRMPAPVPQHTSSPRPNGPSGRSAPAVASSTPSGVRKGVWSNFGASRS